MGNFICLCGRTIVIPSVDHPYPFEIRCINCNEYIVVQNQSIIKRGNKIKELNTNDGGD